MKLHLPESIPPLRGWAWRIFVSIWTVLLVAVMTCTVVSFIATTPWRTNSLTHTIGLQTSYPVIISPIGDEATRSGIKNGDTIVSIDGRPASPNYVDVEQQLAGPVGSVITIETRSTVGRRTIHRLTRDPVHLQQGSASAGISPAVSSVIIIFAGYGLNSVLPLLAAVILLVRRAKDPLAPWLSMLLILLAVGMSENWLSNQGGVLSTIDFISSIIFTGLLILTLALFPDARFTPRVTWIMPPLVLAYCSIFMETSVTNSIVYLVLMIGAVALVGLRYRAMPPGTGRQQIRWALFGLAGACVAFAAMTVCGKFQADSQTYAQWTWATIVQAIFYSLTTLLLFGGMTVSLMRYRLYDADAAISRSVALGALTLSLLAIFAGSEKLIELFGEEYFGQSMGMLAGGLGAAIAAVMITPIHHRITHWAERRFQSALVHLRRGLPLLVADMRENASPQILADTILARIEKGVRAVHGAIISGEEFIGARDIDPNAVAAWLATWQKPSVTGRQLDTDRADPLFPLRIPLRADGIAGDFWLLLGPRPDSSFYGKDERETLIEIADPIARALAVTTERQQRSERIEKEIGKFSAIISAVQRRLNKLDNVVEGLLAG